VTSELEHFLDLAGKVSEISEVLGVSTTGIRAELGYSGAIVLSESCYKSHGMRLVRNGRTGVAGATAMADGSLLVDMAIANARTGPEENLALPSSVEPSEVTLYDEDLEALDGSVIACMLSRLREQLADISPYACVSGSLEVLRKQVLLCNSEGLSCGYCKLLLDWRLRFSFPTGDGFFNTGMSASSGRMDFDQDELVRNASILGNWSRTTTRAPVSCPVLFLPAPLSVLLQAVRTGVSGRSLVNGSSPLTGHVGATVISPVISIWDRPLLDCGASSAPFDAEGVATRDKPLFEKGVFRGFLFDLMTASEACTSSTGNAGRNLDRRPEPVCTNLVLEGGDTTAEEMISSLESGLIVTDILSGEGSDASTGDFNFDSCNVFAIEGGEVAGRVPRALIRGNVYSLLGSVLGMDRRLKKVGSDLFPAILTEGITIR
jgi:PmbA protein